MEWLEYARIGGLKVCDSWFYTLGNIVWSTSINNTRHKNRKMPKVLFYSPKAFLTRASKSEGFFEPGTLKPTGLGATDPKLATGVN